MKLSENLGMVLLGVWLIVSGFFALFHVDISLIYRLIPLLALFAGMLILLKSTSIPKTLGMLFLGILLILKGSSSLLQDVIPYWNWIIQVLSIVAGVFILLKR